MYVKLVNKMVYDDRCTFEDKYVKKNYIVKYKIDKETKKIIVYYLNNEKREFLLTKDNINEIKKNMKHQLKYWSGSIPMVIRHNIVKKLMISNRIKKQLFYKEHKNVFDKFELKKYKLTKKFTKGEIAKFKKSSHETNSYFNLSSIGNYSFNTLNKIVELESNHGKSKK